MSQSLLRSFFQGSIALRGFFIFAFFCLVSARVSGQTVTSDKLDYAPEEIAIISGKGWVNDAQV
jgi:hypothetical protein